jgi:broad specificity phosphatase PhoE
MTKHSPTELLLIRHGEVEERYQHVFGGCVDMELSPLGHEQAVALSAFLSRRKVDALFASPMKRVQQTLSPYARNGAPLVVVLDELREVDFGDWTGHGWGAIREKFGVSAFTWLEQLERGTVPNAERFSDYRLRVAAGLARIRSATNDGTVAVYCHGGVIRMLLALLLDLPFSKMTHFAVDYASVTQVGLKTDRNEVQLLNFVPWRDSITP